jgi:hypothetical protein
MERLRERARKVRRANRSAAIPEGWSKVGANPADIVGIFQSLSVKNGFVLDAYQFEEVGDVWGFVWGMRVGSEFPAPQDCPTVKTESPSPCGKPRARKPAGALDAMQVIGGDDSAWSYFCASILKRELDEFAARWHGICWSSHVILAEDPWEATEIEDLRASLKSKRDEWTMCQPRPQQWKPEFRMGKDEVTVVFFTYSGLGRQTIFKHVDTYKRGGYYSVSRWSKVAEGPPGYRY